VIEPEWLEFDVILAIQEAQLAEHGGPLGIRDRGMLESALARPKNLFADTPETATLSRLAAAYAFGIARNHPFLDGNKRISWVVCAVFLELNGIQVIAEQEGVRIVMLELANGSIGEEEMVFWLEQATVSVVGN
jgi:death-on-curing protein